jgi:uncharacterized protein (TIGR02118 family)
MHGSSGGSSEAREDQVVRRISFIRRKPELTVEEFWTHYRGPHAAIVRGLPGLRRLVLSRPAGPQSGTWDAVGELWFDDREALERAFADPAIVAQLQADRPQFLGAMEVAVVEEAVDWTPPSA